jgi:hypothetical protein
MSRHVKYLTLAVVAALTLVKLVVWSAPGTAAGLCTISDPKALTVAEDEAEGGIGGSDLLPSYAPFVPVTRDPFQSDLGDDGCLGTFVGLFGSGASALIRNLDVSVPVPREVPDVAEMRLVARGIRLTQGMRAKVGFSPTGSPFGDYAFCAGTIIVTVRMRAIEVPLGGVDAGAAAGRADCLDDDPPWSDGCLELGDSSEATPFQSDDAHVAVHLMNSAGLGPVGMVAVVDGPQRTAALGTWCGGKRAASVSLKLDLRPAAPMWHRLGEYTVTVVRTPGLADAVKGSAVLEAESRVLLPPQAFLVLHARPRGVRDPTDTHHHWCGKKSNGYALANGRWARYDAFEALPGRARRGEPNASAADTLVRRAFSEREGVQGRYTFVTRSRSDVWLAYESPPQDASAARGDCTFVPGYLALRCDAKHRIRQLLLRSTKDSRQPVFTNTVVAIVGGPVAKSLAAQMTSLARGDLVSDDIGPEYRASVEPAASVALNGVALAFGASALLPLRRLLPPLNVTFEWHELDLVNVGGGDSILRFDHVVVVPEVPPSVAGLADFSASFALWLSHASKPTHIRWRLVVSTPIPNSLDGFYRARVWGTEVLRAVQLVSSNESLGSRVVVAVDTFPFAMPWLAEEAPLARSDVGLAVLSELFATIVRMSS